MPMYEYQCAQAHVTLEFRAVEARGTPAVCRCGLPAAKAILTAPRVFGDYEGYESPATGRWIEGRRARLEDLKRSGCRPYEAGEREAAAARAAANDRALDAAVDEAVERTLTDLTL